MMNTGFGVPDKQKETMNKRLYPIFTLLIFGGLCFFLSQARPDPGYLQDYTVKVLLDKTKEDVVKELAGKRLVLDRRSNVPPGAEGRVDKWIQQWNQNLEPQAQPFSIELDFMSAKNGMVIEVSEGGAITPLTAHRQQPIRWWSILPPILAVMIALLTQRLVLSLFLGLLVGAIFAYDYNIVAGSIALFSKYIYHSITDTLHLQIIVFSAFLLGMVGVMSCSGGIRGIIDVMQRYTRDRRSTKMMTFVMGLLIFFDDYANCFIIGGTVRPLTDRLKISREKLAYLIDVTAAPVASLAVVSTWIGYEVGLLQDAIRTTGVQMGGYQAFINALPFRFYCYFALMFTFLVIWMRRDFGPMYKAERRALEEGLVIRDGAIPMTSRSFSGMEAKEGVPYRWYNGAVPVLLVLFVTVLGLYVDGGGWAAVQQSPANLFNFKVFSDSFANADSGKILLLSSVVGAFAAIVMVLSQRILSVKETFTAFSKGASSITLALFILVLAWSLSDVSKELGSAGYLISLFKELAQPMWLPLILFLLTGVLTFASGSSWSVMAIFVPMAVPLAYEVGGVPLMLISIGAVFDGAMFGDHCSPLTDTTLLSSIAASSDHMDHVKTQLPYGLLCLVLAGGLGYLPVAMGFPAWLSIVGVIPVMVLFLLLFGRNAEKDLPPSAVTPPAYQGDLATSRSQ